MVTNVIPAERVRPSDFDIFAGLDVDKKSMSITFVDQDDFLKSLKMPCNAQALLSYARKNFADKRIAFAYEAGPTGFSLYDELTAAGERCFVVHPAGIPEAPNNQVKTNRRDSKQLAEALSGGHVKGIRVPTAIYRQLRHLTHLRNSYSAQVRATKCQIKALLLMEGIEFPAATPNSQWSSQVIERLSTLECNPGVRFTLDQRIAQLQVLALQKQVTHKEILRVCKSDPETAASVRYLMSVCGIGPIIACYTVARVGDWRGLRNPRELGAFFGLTPTEHSTGDRTVRGSITRAGDRTLRSMLIEGAWSAVYKDPELAEFYQRIKSRNPKDRASRIAIVAVARKLTARMYAVLTERREYTIHGQANLSADKASHVKATTEE